MVLGVHVRADTTNSEPSEVQAHKFARTFL